MNTAWKLFRFANMLEVFLVAALLAVALFNGRISFKDTSDIAGFLFFLLVAILITGNSIHNILLLRFIPHPDSLPLKRKILYWCMAISVMLVSVCIIIGMLMAYPSIRKLNGINQPLSFGLIITFCWIWTIALNGLYIFFMQVVLFQRIKSVYRESRSLLITEIGESQV